MQLLLKNLVFTFHCVPRRGKTFVAPNQSQSYCPIGATLFCEENTRVYRPKLILELKEISPISCE